MEKLDQIQFTPIEEKSKTCCLNFLLECLKPKKDKDKKYYIEKWRIYLTNESTSKAKMNDPFIILANMWAHKPVIKDLENVRINPNLIRKDQVKTLSNVIIRNDLEFYIPQLCSFIVFGEDELVDELLSFLYKSCYCSFFFAHRVLWFLKSMLSNEEVNNGINMEMNNKISDIIHTIQTIFKSDAETDKKELKKYYIAGGDVFMNYNNKEYFTDFLESEGNNDITADTTYNNYGEHNIIKINIFTKYGYCTNHEEMIVSGGMNSIKQIDENDINLTSFLSNINFFDHLTNICERIRFIDSPEMRQSELIKEITKINENLPYNVYIPFSNKEIRNNLICHISIKDTKVFKTKERAPIILTFECFRLEELCYEHNVKIKTQVLNEEIKTENNKPNDKDNINNDNKNNINNIKIFHNNELYHNSNLGVNIININTKKKKERKRSDSFEINADFSESSSSPDENNSNTFNTTLFPLGLSQNTNLFNKISNYGQTNINTFNILKKNQINNYSLVFGQTLETQEARLKYQSQYGYLSSYKVCKVLIKSGEDLRQEQFASQLINEFAQIFKIEEVDCYLYPYEIISTGNNAGIIEVCPNSISLDELKHKTSFDPNNTLKTFYEKYFGKGTKKYKKPVRNLVRSLAGYSLVCYFLQIKDRHNGNILINNEGYLIQIDFGFFLSNAPGGEFEKAPFKLTDEVIEVIGGINSKYFQIFRKLMWKGMLAIAKHYEKIMILVEMMYCGYGKKLECFKSGDATLTKLRDRFKPKKNMKKRDYLALVDSLIHEALSSWSTKWYDKYQYFFEGIFY